MGEWVLLHCRKWALLGLWNSWVTKLSEGPICEFPRTYSRRWGDVTYLLLTCEFRCAHLFTKDRLNVNCCGQARLRWWVPTPSFTKRLRATQWPLAASFACSGRRKRRRARREVQSFWQELALMPGVVLLDYLLHKICPPTYHHLTRLFRFSGLAASLKEGACNLRKHWDLLSW